MRQHLAALALAALASTASACTTLRVDVLPFAPSEDMSQPLADLQAMWPGRASSALLGAVVTHARADLTGCTLAIGWAAPVVVLAREVAANSCTRDHVMTHEQGHLEIYRRALATLPTRIHELMATGLDALQAAARVFDDVQAEQAAHDSDDELATNRSACGRRLARLVATL